MDSHKLFIAASPNKAQNSRANWFIGADLKITDLFYNQWFLRHEAWKMWTLPLKLPGY